MGRFQAVKQFRSVRGSSSAVAVLDGVLQGLQVRGVAHHLVRAGPRPAPGRIPVSSLRLILGTGMFSIPPAYSCMLRLILGSRVRVSHC